MKKLLFIAIGIFFLIFSCEFNNEEKLYPCLSETELSYQQHVKPILKENCYRCHDNANATLFANGLKFEDYNDLKGLLDANLVLCNIKREPSCLAMPKGAPKLSDCDISKIEKWFNQGYPNN